MSVVLGQMVAVGTSLLWSASSVIFTIGGRHRSSREVNTTRILLALVMLGILQLALFGTLLPKGSFREWSLLFFSGVVGLAVGDAMLFAAFVRIGPRISMLILAMAPVVTTLVAWFAFDEALPIVKIFAILLTISGVAWVVTDREEKGEFRTTPLGVLLAVGGMLGQSGGLLLAKGVMDTGFEPLSATYIRVMGGAAALWMFTLFSGRVVLHTKAFADGKFLGMMLAATVVGPVLGIWSMMYAISEVPLGVASTLISLAPLFLIPISFVVFRDRPGLRGVMGTVIALLGVAGLFLL